MRPQVQLLLAVVLVLIVGYVGYVGLFGDRGGDGLRVLEAYGDVVRVRAGEGSSPASVGEALRPRDQVRVGEGGRAVLAVGAETTLQLESASSVRVLEADDSGVRVELEGGRVRARVRPGSPTLGVSSRGRGALAQNGEFSMGLSLDGAVGIEATAGSVELTGFDGLGTLAAGERVSAAPGRDAVLGAASSDLLLEVEWPDAEEARAEDVEVSGRTGPYATVQVGDGSVQAAGDGRFHLRVPLEEGSNVLRVHASDPLGGSAEVLGEVVKDTTAPEVTRTEVLWR